MRRRAMSLNPLEMLQRIKQKCISYAHIPTILQRIVEECHSFCIVLDGYNFSEESCSLDTLHRIEEHWGSFLEFSDEYLSTLSHLRDTLKQTEEECSSFHIFLSEESDSLDTLHHMIHRLQDNLWQTVEECGSLLIFSKKYLESFPFETLQRIKDECDYLDRDLFAFDELKLLERNFNFLIRDFKFLDIILNLQIFRVQSDLIGEVQDLFEVAAADLIQIYRRQGIHQFYGRVSDLQNKFSQTKLEIRKAKYSFSGVSIRPLDVNDATVIPIFVLEFIDTVIENLSDLLKLDDPSSPLHVGGLVDQVEKVFKELKFLRSSVCFVSDRCIKRHFQYFIFEHALDVALHTTMVTWLYLPSNEKIYRDSAADKVYPLFSDLLREKIQRIDPSIYIEVLRAIKLVQSQWYPVIQIKYAVDCEVGFLETLLHTLEELPISGDCIAKKATLQEMLNFLRTNLKDLPPTALEFHLQHIDSVIVDAGILVYSVIIDAFRVSLFNIKEKDDLDFRVKIQNLQAMIYPITRKTFLLQSNLPGLDGVGSADFILENREKFLSLYSNSVDSVKSQLQTIQKELKCFQAVVETQDGLQHFVTHTNGLMYEVEYVLDAYKKKDVPDWCLFLWGLNIEEDIRVLLAEVADVQEKNAFDIALHNTTDATNADTSSHFARIPGMNEELVGRKDVMDELRRKLTKGSSKLHVISIAGMPGVGKTTLANKLYFDQSVVSHFDIRAQMCFSEEYTRKDMLLTILGDLVGETAELEKQDENVLADKLRKKLIRTRYLIFIDDIWYANAWDHLHLCFPDDNKGSRIILTTRHCDVASHAHDTDPLVLRLLSNAESWTLLQNKVFNKERCPQFLEAVGKSIAQKCGGLPLSIVLVAGILARMEKKKYCWEQLASNLGQQIQPQSEGTINLSYENLPHHLKLCFLYFGVFLEDREIQVSKLTWLWISEGFVTTQTEKLLEDIAKDYLGNLIDRNLVTVAKKSSDGKIKACRIHDLLLEYCRKKAKSENFLERIKGDTCMDPSHIFPPKYWTPRRLSVHSQCNDLEKWCLYFSHVKSFQFREARNIAFSFIDSASCMFKRFKFLRILDLEFTIIDFLPQELTLLRYLAFRTAEDTLSLPAGLLHLETLIVQGMKGRVSLSDTIWKMVKLRHLHIYVQAFFTLNGGEEFSESHSTMDDLQTISTAYFSCVDNADKILTKTPNLWKLRCEVSKFDGSFPAFSNLTKLEMLKVSSSTTLTWINQLKLPSSLKKLTLSNFHIHLTEVATHPKLEVLKLLGVTISYNVWEVNDEQFPQLKYLKLENPSFSEWDASDNAFPRLEHLVLKRCRHLKAIASCFEDTHSLKSVEIISCNESLAKSVIAVREISVENSGTSSFEVFIHK